MCIRDRENPDETAKIITEKEYVSGDADFCAQILKTYNYKPSVQGDVYKRQT